MQVRQGNIFEVSHKCLPFQHHATNAPTILKVLDSISFFSITLSGSVLKFETIDHRNVGPSSGHRLAQKRMPVNRLRPVWPGRNQRDGHIQILFQVINIMT